MLVNLVNSWFYWLLVTTRVISSAYLWCCLIPPSESLRACRSRSQIATTVQKNSIFPAFVLHASRRSVGKHETRPAGRRLSSAGRVSTRPPREESPLSIWMMLTTLQSIFSGNSTPTGNEQVFSRKPWFQLSSRYRQTLSAIFRSDSLL